MMEIAEPGKAFEELTMDNLPSIGPAKLPQTYESAKLALSECSRIDECQDWADKAAALASYAKQSDDETLMKLATRIRSRAIRRTGELLKQIKEGKGGRPPKTDVATDTSLTRKQAAQDAGLSIRQQLNAVRVANVPQKDFDQQVESDKPPTITKLAQQGIRPRKPVVDLKGRDPTEFNRALHFVAEFEDYLKFFDRFDLDWLLPVLIPEEVQRLRIAIGKIDAFHDQIITRI